MKMRRLFLSAVLLIGVNYAIYRFRFPEKRSAKTSDFHKKSYQPTQREENDDPEIFTTSTKTQEAIELTSTKSNRAEKQTTSTDETTSTKGEQKLIPHLTLTRPIGLPPHVPVAQKIADQR